MPKPIDAPPGSIVGGQQGDTLTGDLNGVPTADFILGRGGDDTLFGLALNDSLFGENGRDILVGGLDNDLLFGGNGKDELYGDNNDPSNPLIGGDDMLNGGNGKDSLFGEAGIDVLNGGHGKDLLEGGEGNDTFKFGHGFGPDRIVDFQDDGINHDQIDLSAFELVFDDLDIVDNAVGNAIISLPGGKITLVNVLASSLDDSDFIF